MPIYDYVCKKCGNEIIDVIEKVETDEVHICPECSYIMKRAANCSHFKLKYNPKTDIVDWDGNTTRRYDAWKNTSKEERKDMWLPDE